MKLYRICALFWSWDEDRKAAWEEMRARGRRRFVLTRGVGLYGGWCFVGMTLGMLASRDVFDSPLPFLLLSNAVIWACAGAIWGEVSWWATTRFYEEQFGHKPQRETEV